MFIVNLVRTKTNPLLAHQETRAGPTLTVHALQVHPSHYYTRLFCLLRSAYFPHTELGKRSLARLLTPIIQAFQRLKLKDCHVWVWGQPGLQYETLHQKWNKKVGGVEELHHTPGILTVGKLGGFPHIQSDYAIVSVSNTNQIDLRV